jgi:hypothetical protein
MKQKKKSKRIKSLISEPRKVLGVVASFKNLFIAIALLFAFLGGFFNVYKWLDTTYAREQYVRKVRIENDYRWESTILSGMYSRFCSLDNLISFAMDPTKIDPERKTEYIKLKGEIKLQEDKVTDLQKKLRE